VDVPGIGPLRLDESLDWYYSDAVRLVGLEGIVGHVVLTEGYLADDDKPAFHDAIAEFLAINEDTLRAASADVFDYYLDTFRIDREQGWGLDLPEIPDPDSVWDYVSFGTAFHFGRDQRRRSHVFASVECECAWEREHGLQIVLRDGRTISKVGPYDGHLTNADAYADDRLDAVVYVSPFAL